MTQSRTQVVIVGAGPVGMLLGLLLERAGIDCVVLERRTRAHVLSRIRAGLLEPGTVEFLRASGVGERMDKIGRPRDGTRIAWQGRPSFMIDVKRWTGLEMMAYGQTFLTEDLYALREATGTPYFDEVSDLVIEGVDGTRPSVSFTTPSRSVQMRCDFVVGCDGAQGHCSQLVPDTVRQVYQRTFPFGWLGIMVEAPPIDDFTYIRHETGFALAAQRTPMLSRYYLQSDLDEGVDAWSDDRFWKTFLSRCPPEIAEQVVTGPSIEKSLFPLRSRVIEPMRWGRLFLAGDAAHVFPPTGAKGLNLALSDIQLLSAGLIAHFTDGDDGLLDRYSSDALSRVWAATNLSWRMTKLLHIFPSDDAYDQRIRQSEYDLLLESEEVQRSMAHEYAGLPSLRG